MKTSRYILFSELKPNDVFSFWIYGLGYLTFIKIDSNTAKADTYKKNHQFFFNSNDLCGV